MLLYIYDDDVYHVMEEIFKLQFVVVMEDIFYSELHDNNVGYTYMTTREHTNCM